MQSEIFRFLIAEVCMPHSTVDSGAGMVFALHESAMITKETSEQYNSGPAVTDFNHENVESDKMLPDKRSEARKAFDETKKKIANHGNEIAGRAKESATAQADEAVRTASQKVRNFEKAAHEAIASLQENQSEHVVTGVRYFADRVGNVAEYLESKDSKELASDARQLVRENPGAVLGGLAVAGFCLGRFLKATTRDA